MWYTDWLGDLIFGDEPIFAFRVGNCRTMRYQEKMSPNANAKHIASRKSLHKRAAVDGYG